MKQHGGDPGTVDVSVVICSYTEQRWDQLCEAVNSALAQQPAPRDVVLVVDHNPALLQRIREQSFEVRVVENHRAQGLSGARSCGIEASQGAIIAFLDDDAIAMPGWLEHLAAAFENPAVLSAGGRTEPLWVSARPPWVPEEFLWAWGCSYRGMPEVATAVRNNMGGNMAVRRDVLEALGGFTTGIGRVGADLRGCEETELCIRASQRWPDGLHIYEPQAVIYHRVEPERARWRYLVRRCYGEGRSKARVTGSVGMRDALATERRYVSRVLLAGVLRALAHAAKGDVAALGQAAAIVAGLSAAVAGYVSPGFFRARGWTWVQAKTQEATSCRR
jgi:GT2 family glycosyltransferase